LVIVTLLHASMNNTHLHGYLRLWKE